MTMHKQWHAISMTKDVDANAGYIYFSHKTVATTETLTDSVLVDLDEFGIVVGIEVLNLSAEIPLEELERKYHLHSNVQYSFNTLKANSQRSVGVDGRTQVFQPARIFGTFQSV